MRSAAPSLGLVLAGIELGCVALGGVALGGVALGGGALGCGARSALDETVEVDGGRLDAGSATNACGGTAALVALPRQACGTCGLYACDGLDALRCDEDGALNACGECGPLPMEECNERDDDCDRVVDEGCVIRAGTLSTSDTFVRVSGRRLVFDAMSYFSNNEDVVLVDLDDFGAEILTPHGDPIDGPGDPSPERRGVIGGRYVAWIRRGMDVSNPVGELQAYDIDTRTQLMVPQRGAAGEIPAIDGDRIVWQSRLDPRGDADVVAYDVTTLALEVLAGSPDSEMSPDLSGRWLVYEIAPPDQELARRIEALDLESGERVDVSGDLEGFHSAPAIDGTRIVWERDVNIAHEPRRWDVFVYDLATRERRMISTGAPAMRPRISGDLVCWSTTSQLNPAGGQWETGGVTVHDLATGRQAELTSQAHLCDIDGRTVAWLERRGDLDPYVYTLRDGEP
ncbi:MAG: hypothetical protein AB7S26_00160 [Sandaracinaceae bacterium]